MSKAVPPLPPDGARLQATLVDFALAELVRQHRSSFQPFWTSDSWAKLLIWLALNCGCSGDEASLHAFAGALGPALGGRLRRVFFERELEDLGLQVLADPAEQQVLVQPLVPGAAIAAEQVSRALERLDLLPLVVEADRWQSLESLVAVPWQLSPGQQQS